MKFKKIRKEETTAGAIIRGVFQDLKDTESSARYLGSYGSVNFVNANKIPVEVIIGLGRKEEFSKKLLRDAISSTVRELCNKQITSASIDTDSFLVGSIEQDSAIQVIVEGSVIGSSIPGDMKTVDDKDRFSDMELLEIITGIESSKFEQMCHNAEISGRYTNFARNLINLPANIVTPAYLLEAAEMEAMKLGVQVSSLDRSGIEDAGMNLLLAVSSGSVNEPYFIEMKYDPADGNGKLLRIVLIGKGITFDTGGINLKNMSKLRDMQSDMAGAAAVMSIIFAAAQLKLPVQLIALISACENSPSGSSMRPGDVVKSKKGITVEIADTDAEGRLILADALAYANELDADYIIDISTLSGSVISALGEEVAALFTGNDDLAGMLLKSSSDTDEPLWRMPLWEPYKENLKSEVADIRNIGKYGGGAITAALFLKEFVENKAYAHIDIAGTAFPSKKTNLTGHRATGFGVRLLIDFLKNLCNT